MWLSLPTQGNTSVCVSVCRGGGTVIAQGGKKLKKEAELFKGLFIL